MSVFRFFISLTEILTGKVVNDKKNHTVYNINHILILTN